MRIGGNQGLTINKKIIFYFLLVVCFAIKTSSFFCPSDEFFMLCHYVRNDRLFSLVFSLLMIKLRKYLKLCPFRDKISVEKTEQSALRRPDRDGIWIEKYCVLVCHL